MSTILHCPRQHFVQCHVCVHVGKNMHADATLVLGFHPVGGGGIGRKLPPPPPPPPPRDFDINCIKIIEH